MSADYPVAEESGDIFIESPSDSEDEDVLYEEQVTPEHGVLGFTLRELLIVGVWVILFATSFFPLYGSDSPSLWMLGLRWLLPIGVPTVAVFLIVLRRFSPDGIRRVGSLGIDQFASVAFSVAAVTWVQLVWEQVALSIRVSEFSVTWLTIVQLVVTLALVVLTVFAPLIPGLSEDFHGRLETLAHRNANPVRPVIARPRAVVAAAPIAPSFIAQPDAAASVPLLDAELTDHSTTDEFEPLSPAAHVPLGSHASGGGTGSVPTIVDDEYTPAYARRSRRDETASAEDAETPTAETVSWRSLDDTNPRDAEPAAQPFWILAPTPRDVYDERGASLFRIGPDAWALVIEDRGGAYVVRHDDGRIGYLHDISDITKG